jgi:hypothetical protein
MLKICPSCHKTFSGGRLCLTCPGSALLDVADAATRPHLKERELQHTINTYYGARSAMLLLFIGMLLGGGSALLLARRATLTTGPAWGWWLAAGLALPLALVLALWVGGRVVHFFSAVCRGKAQSLDDLRLALRERSSPRSGTSTVPSGSRT